MAQRIGTLALIGLLLAACRQAEATVYAPKTADFRGGPTRTGVMAADLTAHPLQAWTFEPGAAIATAPALTTTEVFVATAKGDVVAVDLKSGAERWRVTTGEGTLTSPVLMNDVLLFGTRAGNAVSP
jgi:outer membrane protein assembly factor BamB